MCAVRPDNIPRRDDLPVLEADVRQVCVPRVRRDANDGTRAPHADALLRDSLAEHALREVLRDEQQERVFRVCGEDAKVRERVEARAVPDLPARRLDPERNERRGARELVEGLCGCINGISAGLAGAEGRREPGDVRRVWRRARPARGRTPRSRAGCRLQGGR